MALCRTLLRQKRVMQCLSQRTTQTLPLISHKERRYYSLNEVNAITEHTGVSQTSFNSPGKKWGLYLGAFAIVGGITVAFIKDQLKTVYCAEQVTKQDLDKWNGIKVTLYQYQTCPFCTKVRMFLTYHQIPFEMVEVHPIFKKEIKFSQSKSKKVPLVTIKESEDSWELQDSSLIISVLRTFMVNTDRKISDIMREYPPAKLLTENGEKEVTLNKYWVFIEEPDTPTPASEDDPRQRESDWRQWTDDYLVHLISPNVYRTYPEAYQAFKHHVKMGRFNGTWEGVVAKVGGSFAMWIISKKLKKKYKMQEDVRIDLYLACNKWCDAIGKGNKFMGGKEPNLADLSVFGVLSVMEGLVSYDDMMKYTKIKPWYFRMKQAIEERS